MFNLMFFRPHFLRIGPTKISQKSLSINLQTADLHEFEICKWSAQRCVRASKQFVENVNADTVKLEHIAVCARHTAS